MEFIEEHEKRKYIKLQIDGNPLLLKLFPTIKHYYSKMLKKYKKEGLFDKTTKLAKNKL